MNADLVSISNETEHEFVQNISLGYSSYVSLLLHKLILYIFHPSIIPWYECSLTGQAGPGRTFFGPGRAGLDIFGPCSALLPIVLSMTGGSKC